MSKILCKKSYCCGVTFLLLMMLFSCANDVIAKYMGQRLDPMEVIFFRFLFSFITLLPFAILQGKKSFKTSRPLFNLVRGVLGSVSFYLYTCSIVHMNIVEVVTIFWTIPLFVLVLAAIYLNESISFTRWGATVIGFLGLAFITLYDSGVSFSLKLIYIVPIASAFLFAVQDIMIKKMVVDENRIAMLLYFSIVTSLITFIPAMLVWKTPTSFEFAMLMLLGASANLMQYFLFRAFEATDLSALAPFRYVEFLLSALTAFIFFSEIPGLNVLIGAVILIPSTFYLACNENKKRKEAVA